MSDAPIEESRALQRAISARIRKLRLEKGWSLDTLAGMCGLSKGYLSQIENGEKNPTIGTLTKIAFGLGIDTLFLITGEHTDPANRNTPKCSLVKAHERRPIIRKDAPAEYIYESVNYGKPDRLMNAFVVTVGSTIPEGLLAHEGQEIVYALEGRHEFHYDGETMILEPGDCLCFDADRPHFSRSLDETPARVLVVFCPFRRDS
jgi:transcriptional regulator with XRE-family HTH domain